MRILIFATNYLPNVGGAEIAVKEITDRLPQYQFDMVVPRLSRRLPKKERIGNVYVHRIGLGITLDKFFVDWMLFRAWRLQRKHAYDCVWTLMASQASVAAALFKKLHAEVPLLLTLQEGDEEAHLKRYVFGSDRLYKWLIHPWYTLVFRHADAATAISNYLIERAVQNGIEREQITLVPNGVDVDRFAPLPAVGGLTSRSPDSYRGGEMSDLEEQAHTHSSKETQHIRKKLNLGADEIIVFTASRLVQKNGIGDLVSAMKYLPDNIKLVIAGDGEEKEALKARAYKWGEKVQFVGSVPHEKLPAYLHASDVFVRPSLSEGMGNSFIEAMAAGVPVVATEVGGIPDFLEHEQTGLFCNVKDPQSIALQITRLLDDEVLRKRVVQNAQEMVEERYSWNIIAERMKEVFDKI